MDNIQRWLKSLRLHKYQPLFKTLTYEEMLNLDEAFLIDQQVTKGARNKILVSVRKLNMRHIRLIHLVDDINQGNLSMKEALTTLNDMLITPIPAAGSAENAAAAAVSLGLTGGVVGSSGGGSSTNNQLTTPPLSSSASSVLSSTTTTPSPPTPLSSSSSTSGFCSDSDAISVSSMGSLMSTASNDPHHLTYLFVDAFEKVARKLIESADYEDAACHGIMATIVDECLKHNSFTKEQKARVARFRQPHINRQYHRHPLQRRQQQLPQPLVRQCHQWQQPFQPQQQQQQQPNHHQQSHLLLQAQQQQQQQQRRHQSQTLTPHYHSWHSFKQQPHQYPYQQQQQQQQQNQQVQQQQQLLRLPQQQYNQQQSSTNYKEYSLLSPCLTFELPCLRARISGSS